jgi:vacuolar-type H+-ATPase subunit E/Vma4
MSRDTLERLFTEIDTKLQHRLKEVEQNGMAQLRQLESEKYRQQEDELAQQKKNHNVRLQRNRSNWEREIRHDQEKRIWNFQFRCVQQVMAKAKDELNRCPMEQQQLDDFVQEAGNRLGNPKHLLLKLKAEHISSLKLGDIEVEEIAILGGAILQDSKRNIEIDGSWECRLENLESALWKRWHRDVSENHQD